MDERDFEASDYGTDICPLCLDEMTEIGYCSCEEDEPEPDYSDWYDLYPQSEGY